MKRNMDLIRELMIRIEDHPIDTKSDIKFDNIEGFSDQEIQRHLKLLCDAGFVEAEVISGARVNVANAQLTWAGYDFLDAARDNKRWKRAKEVANKAGGVAFDVFLSILKVYATQAVKELTGE